MKIPPPPPTIEQIARGLNTTPEQVRKMGERYRRIALGLPVHSSVEGGDK